MSNPAASNKKLVTKLCLIVGGMFVFCFALIPLYDVICEVTGLNGKTSGRYAAGEQPVVQEDRKVRVQFTTQRNAGMVWEFTAMESQVTVSPGEVRIVIYKVRNPTDRVMVGQAIPSVAPNNAAAYLNKIECFCFQEQRLEPGEEAEMPLRFFIDENLPDSVNKLTLSYSLFDITKGDEVSNELAKN